ncbi:MAG: response regulator [Longicatena sp.]
MYDILIVEDEEFERTSLMKIIQKEFSEINEIATANNSVEALSICNTKNFDIIFMDINIPGINGLTLIKKIQEISPTSLFLVVSSYNYFEYAQTAISLGVKYYILKPYKIEKLISQVHSLIQEINEKKEHQQHTQHLIKRFSKVKPLLDTEIIYSIAANKNKSEVTELLECTNYEVACGFCIIFYKSSQSLNETHKKILGIHNLGYYCIVSELNKLIIIFVLSSNSITPEEQNKISIDLVNNKDSSNVGIGSLQYDVLRFHQSYMDAKNRLKSSNEHKTSVLHSTKNLSKNNKLENYVTSILKSLNNNDDSLLFSYVHNFVLDIIEDSIEEINEKANLLILLLVKKLNENMNIPVDQATIYTINVKESNKSLNLELDIFYSVQNILNPIRSLQEKNSNLLVNQALVYIQNNYKKVISLNDLADHLKVSPYYISRLLNKHSSKNFTDLINDNRIEEAKRKLKLSYSIKEVAYDVGYQSQSYFSKIFKEYTGLSPKEYKNSSNI